MTTTSAPDRDEEVRWLLWDLHSAVAQELLNRIASGEAKPADLAVAVRFLKDNGVDAEQGASSGDYLRELANSLPFPVENIEPQSSH